MTAASVFFAPYLMLIVSGMTIMECFFKIMFPNQHKLILLKLNGGLCLFSQGSDHS